MAEQNIISLRKGDTLVKYTIKRDPIHGIDLTFTVHQALQNWMRLVATACVEEGTTSNGEDKLALYDMDRGAQRISILDEYSSLCWQFNRSEFHSATAQPSLRFEESSYWYNNLAFLRLCTDSLTRRIAIRADSDHDLWRKQYCDVKQADRHNIAVNLDRSIKQLVLGRVVVEKTEVTTAHVIS
jgi:hypothetical protein